MIIAAISFLSPPGSPPPVSFQTCPRYSVVAGYTGPVDRCGFPLQSVPGPLPVAAVGGAWVWSRRIRSRIRQATPTKRMANLSPDAQAMLEGG